KELINYAPCTIIPNMPHFIKGMVNLRGLVIPVMDLRLRFGVGEATYHRYTVIMVVQVEGRLSGLIVDAVADVLAVPHETVQPPPDHLSPLDISFIAGVVKVRGNMVILLNPERLLAKEVLLMSSPLAEEETP
ncbi:MAG: chemotaxis protein CheW, partial [Magnetococcales bacterium]|nr:chemotaxis protein CheW [Magnetococcales bacterium]